MARTDKDTPRWVLALTDPNSEIDHHYACCDNPERRRYIPDNAPRPCTLEQPPRSPLDCQRRTYRAPTGGTQRDLVRAQWTRPERAAVRNALRVTLRDWNTYGDTDLDADIPMSRHRHAAWGGGWVD